MDNAMSVFGRLALTMVLAATLLHALPMFAPGVLESAAKLPCHQHQKTKPVGQDSSTNVCCAVHRSAIVRPSWIPQAPDHTRGMLPGNSFAAVNPDLQIHFPIVRISFPPGPEPLRI
jgi:hypothetical protein